MECSFFTLRRTMGELICALVVIVNISGHQLNEVDNKAIARSRKVCATHYSNPLCLKKFIKKEELVYRAICAEDIVSPVVM